MLFSYSYTHTIINQVRFLLYFWRIQNIHPIGPIWECFINLYITAHNVKALPKLLFSHPPHNTDPGDINIQLFNYMQSIGEKPQTSSVYLQFKNVFNYFVQSNNKPQSIC